MNETLDYARFVALRDDAKKEYDRVRAEIERGDREAAMANADAPRVLLDFWESTKRTLTNAMLPWVPKLNEVDWRFPELAEKDIQAWGKIYLQADLMVEAIQWLRRFGSEWEFRQMLDSPYQADLIRQAVGAVLLQRRQQAEDADFWRRREGEVASAMEAARKREYWWEATPPYGNPAPRAGGGVASTPLPYANAVVPNEGRLPHQHQYGFPWTGRGGETYRSALAEQEQAAMHLSVFAYDVIVLLRTARSSYNDLYGGLRAWFFIAAGIFAVIIAAIAAIVGPAMAVAAAAAAGSFLMVAAAGARVLQAVYRLIYAVGAQILVWLGNREQIRKNADTFTEGAQSFDARWSRQLGQYGYNGGIMSPEDARPGTGRHSAQRRPAPSATTAKWPDPTKRGRGHYLAMGQNAAGQVRPYTGSEADDREGYRPIP